MNPQRRNTIRAASGLGILGLLGAAGLVLPGAALAGMRKAFDAGNLAEALQALGVSKTLPGDGIRITAPEVAENGAAVPLGVSSSLAGVERIALLVEKNVNPLVASFVLPEGTEAVIQTRVKMNQTSNVIALVKAGGAYYLAVREVQVIVGGCGG